MHLSSTWSGSIQDRDAERVLALPAPADKHSSGRLPIGSMLKSTIVDEGAPIGIRARQGRPEGPRAREGRYGEAGEVVTRG